MKQIFGVLLLFTALVSTGCAENAQTGNAADALSSMGEAPAFPDGMEWLNTDRPLSLEELRGKIVLLDFWTYCCINCIHIMPDLKKLEQKYSRELVVIGVHSAKFLTEQSSNNIRQAILRYDIEHPVVNDKNLEIWKKYHARAWPTLVLIDPRGNIVARRAGENIFEPMDRKISRLIDQYTGQIDTTTIDFALEKEKTPMTFLKFPGKVTADAASKRLYITDSNNNRIVITDLHGKLLDIIGSGETGRADGGFDEAQFRHPQGTVVDGDALYIADTENHLLRKADLSSQTVETIAGTGKQVYQRFPDGNARNTHLNSPWDLTLVRDTLYIAMAGSHQLWRIDPGSNEISLFAGNGAENIVDGPRREAELAQPSGLTTNGDRIYFADSEVSGIRSAEIGSGGRVRTIIGHGLFEYGDVDGNYRKARLQHPLGIVFVDGMLYVADTYNNKIKRIDPDARRSETYAGTGAAGQQDGALSEATFDEPGGIAYADGKLYIADTNNHLGRIIDMEAGLVSSLNISNINPAAKPKPSAPTTVRGTVHPAGSADLSSLDSIRFSVSLPKGYKLNPLAESAIRLFTSDGSLNRTRKLESTSFAEPVAKDVSGDTLYAELLIYYCREDNEGLCYIDEAVFGVANAHGKSAGEITVSLEVRME